MTTHPLDAAPDATGAAAQLEGSARVLAELEREAERARELIKEVDRLVPPNQPRREDFNSDLIERAERTVSQQLVLGRDAAAVCARPDSPELERRSAEAMLQNAGSLIRRAALLVQVQVFALDGMLERRGGSGEPH